MSVGRSGPVAFFATLGDFCPKNPDRTAKGQAQTSAECGIRKLSTAKAASVDSLSVGRSGKPDRTAKGQAQANAECGIRKLSAASRLRGLILCLTHGLKAVAIRPAGKHMSAA